jgi:hypothetical protein
MGKKSSMGVLVAAVVGLLPLATYAVDAPNLEGTWVGKNVCKSFDGEKFSLNCCETVEITKVTDTTFNMSVSDGTPLRYFGRIIPDADKPATTGQAAFVECGTDKDLPDDSEMGRITKIKVDAATGQGTFHGESIYYFDQEVGTCRWTYKRVNTVDPTVPACD